MIIEDKDWAKKPAYPDSQMRYSVPLTPHACPICHGQGHVSKPPWIAGDVHQWISSMTSYVCRVCNGGGIVWR